MNQAEQKARIIALEQHLDKLAWRVDRNAELMAKGITGNATSIERLETAVLDLHDRVGKLEAETVHPYTPPEFTASPS